MIGLPCHSHGLDQYANSTLDSFRQAAAAAAVAFAAATAVAAAAVAAAASVAAVTAVAAAAAAAIILIYDMNQITTWNPGCSSVLITEPII